MEEEPRDAARAHASAPAVHVHGDLAARGGRGSSGASRRVVREGEDAPMHHVELGAHRAHAEHHRGAAASLGEAHAHARALLVREQGDVDGAGDVALGELTGRPHVHDDDGTRVRAVAGRRDDVRDVRVELRAPDRELALDARRERLHRVRGDRGVVPRERRAARMAHDR